MLKNNFKKYKKSLYTESTRNISDCDQSNVLLTHLFPPDRRQDIGDICHISRVIANFVSNFVAMAIRVGQR